MKKKILVFLTDEYADNQPALAASELNRPETGMVIKTIAVDKQPVQSMGGFTVLPDYSIGELDVSTENVGMLILPGGLRWLDDRYARLSPLIDACIEQNIPIAAIADGVTFLAMHGYLDNIRHTGNTPEYLKLKAPDYAGEAFFEKSQVVTDRLFITANGTAAIEFAREILAKLEVVPHMEYAKEILDLLNINLGTGLSGWYTIWKRGLYS